jgi:glycosyltransferase involved in cell wall biosynthesis
MKLLILTQKVDKNDSVLGFFHRWIEEFSKNFESVTVICLYKGEYSLPNNVKVLSLGKEAGVSRIKYVFNFYKYIVSERKNYDKVFIHMNQIYALLGGLYWKVIGKDVYLWYTHKSVTVSLKLALLFVKKVFTASAESFRIKTEKLKVMSHGIDLDLFSFDQNKIYTDKLRLITIGRISRSKDLVTILNAVSQIRNDIDISLDVVGEPVTNDDKKYFEDIKKVVAEKSLATIVNFVGPKTQTQIVPLLKDADLFIHTSTTGSLDKAALEAMACGTLVMSSNDALLPILYPYGLTFKPGDVIFLSNELKNFVLSNNKNETRIKLRKMVEDSHSLVKLIHNLKNEIK